MKSAPLPSGPGPYWQLAYYSFVGYLFWSIFLIQVPYIEDYFGGRSVMFYIVLSYGVSANVVRLYLIGHYQVFTHGRLERRVEVLVYYGAGLTAVTLVMYPVAMAVIGSGTMVGFWVCLVLTTIMGAVNSLLINAGFVLMSISPKKSVGFFLLGQTFTPVLCWPFMMGLRAFVKLVSGADEERISYIVAITSLCGAAVLKLATIPLYVCKTKNHPDLVEALKGTLAKRFGDEITTETVHPPTPMKLVARAIFAQATSIWLTCFFTFLVYPSQVSIWSPSYPDWYNKDAYRSFLIYIYSVTDLLGRMAVQYWGPILKHSTDTRLLVAAVTRGVVLGGMFIITSACTGTAVVSSDFLRLFIVLMYGFTNGAVVAVANTIAPTRVKDHDRLKSGTIMSFVGVNGLLFGSLAGIGIKSSMLE